MKEDQTIDPVKLDLCEYQAIEPVHPYHSVREDDDSIVAVSPYEALVINDASKIGAIESLPDPEPQPDTIAADRTPHPISEPHAKKDQILIGDQSPRHGSVVSVYGNFETPAPGFDIQGQGCLDFSPE